MSRTPLLAGNWKMHHGPAAAAELAAAVSRLAEGAPAIEIAIFAPFVSLSSAAAAIAGGSVRLGAQNAHESLSGAFTGEISATMLSEVCQLVLLGHSERRHIYQESDSLIGAKVEAAVAAGLDVVLCVGETLEQRRAGSALSVVESQLEAGLAGITMPATDQILIAYEPVWAIGTGLNATPEQAGEACGAVRKWLSGRYSDGVAGRTRVLYGGSVNAANWAEISTQDDIDGALVGGASLSAESFGALAVISQAQYD